MLKQVLALMALCGICGCGSITDSITLKPDGSGVFSRTMVLAPEAADILRSANTPALSGPFGINPDVVEARVRAAFAGEGLTVTAFKTAVTENGTSRVEYTVTFAGIQALVKAGFPQGLGLEFKATADGKVMISQGVQRAILPMLSAGGNPAETLNYLRFMGRGFQYTCIMEMPGKIETTNGQLTGERTVDWTWKASDLTAADLTAAEGVFANAYATIDKGTLTFTLPAAAVEPDITALFRPRKPPAKSTPTPPPSTDIKPEEFTFEIESVNISRHVMFRHNTPVANNSTNMLDVGVYHPPGLMPISYMDVKLDTLVTDTGEELGKDAGNAFAWRGETPVDRFSFRGRGEREPKFDIQLQFRGAQKKFDAIKAMNGSFTLKYAGGIGEPVTIDKVGQWTGKRLEGKGLEDREITVEALTADSIRIAFANRDKAELREIIFYDKDGKPLEDDDHMGAFMSTGTTMDDTTTTEEFRYAGGPEGRMTLVFYRDIRTVAIPFRLADITLLGGANEDGMGTDGWDEDFNADDIEMVE